MEQIGIIIALHGKHGGVLMGDCPPNFLGFKPKSQIQAGYSKNFAKKFVVESCEEGANGGFIVFFEGIEKLADAEKLIKMAVFAENSSFDSRTTKGFNSNHILGCEVLDHETKQKLGTITDIWYLPANDAWVMDFGGKEIPIPAVDAIVKRVNIEQKEIEIFVMPGLLEFGEEGERDD